MRKYPSYTAITPIAQDKKPPMLKNDKSMTTFITSSNIMPSTTRHVPLSLASNNSKTRVDGGKEGMIKVPSKKNLDLGSASGRKKDSKKGHNENSNSGEKYEYEALKSRLHALEDRLVEIKKSYELRKNKAHNFSSEKAIHRNGSTQNKDTDKGQKLFLAAKKKITLDTKACPQNLTSRLAVQSPKVQAQQPLQQINNTYNSKKQHLGPPKCQSNLSSNSILSEYVTQYEQRPVPFKHTTSEVNLLKPAATKNKSIEKTKKQIRYNQIYYVSAVLKAIESPSPSSFDQLCSGHLLASFEFLCYVKTANIQKPQKVTPRPLPSPSKRISIIFDLDETLIHCVDAKKSTKTDISLAITFPDRNKVTVGINIRPYTQECLRQLSKHFELIVFTASHANYASAIVEQLDPNHQLISHWFSREHCHKTQEGFYVKDLRVIDRKPEHMLLIDNAAYSYSFQPENGVPIVPFYDNKADLQLKNLIPYLKQFINQPDVRVRNSQIMKLTEYPKYRNAQELINALYRP